MNHILFPITYDCNLDCTFCSAKYNREKKIDIRSSLLNIMSKRGVVEWVYITGGEPFIVDELFDVCDELRKNGFKVGVTTNGTVYKPDVVEHADRVGISFDGDEEYHDKYRGEGVYASAMKLFLAIKGKCETVVMSVAFKDNIDALHRFAGVVKDMDPTYWQVQRDLYDSKLIVPDF